MFLLLFISVLIYLSQFSRIHFSNNKWAAWREPQLCCFERPARDQNWIKLFCTYTQCQRPRSKAISGWDRNECVWESFAFEIELADALVGEIKKKFFDLHLALDGDQWFLLGPDLGCGVGGEMMESWKS